MQNNNWTRFSRHLCTVTAWVARAFNLLTKKFSNLFTCRLWVVYSEIKCSKCDTWRTLAYHVTNVISAYMYMYYVRMYTCSLVVWLVCSLVYIWCSMRYFLNISCDVRFSSSNHYESVQHFFDLGCSVLLAGSDRILANQCTSTCLQHCVGLANRS